MATLEKIRSKSVLLFAIIIIALLAFILGDFLTSGSSFFGNSTRVAKVDGNKVEYQEYSALKENLSRLHENDRDNYDDGQLSQDALSQLLYDKLFASECEDLGLVVTDAEITAAMLGQNPNPLAIQLFNNAARAYNQTADPATIFDMVKQPVKYGLSAQQGEELKAAWNATEKDVELALLEDKFYNLLNGLYTANDVDAKSVYDDNATTRHFAYASQSAGSLNDDDFTVTDDDIKLVWQNDKERFKLEEELRAIDYILVPIVASADDRAAALAEVKAATEALNGSEGTNAVMSNSKFKTEDYSLPLSQLSALISEAREYKQRNNVNTVISNVGESSLRTFLENSKADSAYLNISSPTRYIIAKNLGDTVGVDQINISFLAFDTEKVKAEDVIASLNEGKESFKDLAAKRDEGYMGQDSISGYINTVVNQTIPVQSFRDALTTETVGKAFAYNDTIQGTPLNFIVKVNSRTEAPIYHFAVVEYDVEASDATRNDITSKLATFVSNNSSADEFAKNASSEEYGYIIESGAVAPSATRIGNAKDSYQFVKWAMEAEKGKVSPMLIDSKQTYALAIAVKDIYDDDYLPWNSPLIYDMLRTQAINAKKVEKLAADYTGKGNTVEELAAAMEVTPAESDFNFNSNYVRGLNNEAGFYGALAAAEDGKFVGPVKGDNGIIFFQVLSTNNDSRPINDVEFKGRFNQMFGFVNQLVNPRNPNLNRTRVDFLRGDEKVLNESLKFVAPVGE